LKKGLELLFDKIGRSRPGLTPDLDKEALDLFLYQRIQSRLFGTLLFVVYALSHRRRLNRFVHRP
jgi:hypothetical protein